MDNPLSIPLTGPNIARPRIARIISRWVFEDTNAVRQQYQRSVLTWDEQLAQTALQHCQNMARHGYLGHVNPMGQDVSHRLYKREPAYRGIVGENCFVQYSNGPIILANAGTLRDEAWEVVHDLMESPGHRENILYPHYTHLGVGVFVTAYYVFVTQVFMDLQYSFHVPDACYLRTGQRVTFRIWVKPKLWEEPYPPLIYFTPVRYAQNSGAIKGRGNCQVLHTTLAPPHIILQVRLADMPGQYYLKMKMGNRPTAAWRVVVR